MKKILITLFAIISLSGNVFAGCYTQSSYNEFMREWTTQEVCDFGQNNFFFPEYYQTNYSYNPIFDFSFPRIDFILPVYYVEEFYSYDPFYQNYDFNWGNSFFFEFFW